MKPNYLIFIATGLLLVEYCFGQSTTTQKPISFVLFGVGGFHAYWPCDEQHLFRMSKFIGGHPDMENSWEGYFPLDYFPPFKKLNFTITFDASATIKLIDSYRLSIHSVGRIFTIENINQNYEPNLQFVVQGTPGGEFPSVESITLNGMNVCHNPKKWKSVILGYNTNIAVINDNDSKNNENCGKSLKNFQETITNGYETEEGDWPWHAAIFRIGNNIKKYICGGTLINQKHILTAAHCVFERSPLKPSELLIELGKHNINRITSHTQEFKVKKISIHENYTESNYQNDIAIIELIRPIVITNYVQPICLWKPSDISIEKIIHQNGTIVGWGLNEKNMFPEILNKAIIQVVSFAECLDSKRAFFASYLNEKNFCAGYRNGTSACNGDSGGGMYFKYNGKYRIRGIVSLSSTRKLTNNGDKTCDPFDYAIFTDVAQYLEWINKIIN